MSVEKTERSYDLSTFITGGKTLLISDFEGTTPTRHFDKFAEYCTTKQVIFLGDVFDNTAQTVKSCDKDSCKDPDEDIGNCVNVENYCSLKTIKLLIDNEERCKYVVGNRDINKIKLLPFFSFAEGEPWWTDGNSYHDIVNNLLTKLDGDADPWLIKEEDKKYFRPFWSNGKLEYLERWVNNKVITGQQKVINEKGEEKKENIWEANTKPLSDILSRFEWIFGKDPDSGTMSALVTLKCMPDELCSHMEYANFAGFFEQIKNKKDTVEFKKKVRAALTITIFMRMLSDTPVVKRPSKNIREEVWKYDTLDGYLKHYLKNATPAYYAEHENNLFLFAHGGITNEFVMGEGKKGIDDINKLTYDTWMSSLKYLPEAPKPKPAKGGGIKDEPAIPDSIKNYNRAYFNLLNAFFQKDTKEKILMKKASPEFNKNTVWFKHMLSLLKLSAGNVKGVTDYYPNQVKEPSDAVLDNWYSGNIYNIFGHASASVGYSFGKMREKTNGAVSGDHTYFLNTDYSATLFKDGLVCISPSGPESEYNQNYLICVLDTKSTDTQKFKLTIEGTLILKNEPKEYEIFDKRIDDIIMKEKLSLFVPLGTEISKPPTLEFDGEQNLLDVIKGVDEINKTKICKYNGNAMYNGTNYNVFSNMWVKGIKNYSTVLVKTTKQTATSVEETLPPSEEETLPLPEEETLPLPEDVTPPASVEEGQGIPPEDLIGGGRRKRRTRKRSGTKKAKKGGKRKTKKGGRKTRRKYKKRS
jgi:hypothetical protein